MNNIHLKNCERSQRVISFVDSESEDFPEGSKGAAVCALVKEDLAKLTDLDVMRSSSMSKRKQGTSARQDARKALASIIKAVVDTADAIVLDRPNVKGIFVRPQKNSNDQTLIANARAFADAAAPLVGLFTDYGLPATFIASLRSHADSLEHAIQLQTDGVGARVRTNAQIDKIIRHMNELIDRLDVLVRNKYHDDPARLAAWESARRLEHASRSNRNGGTDTPPPEQ